MVSSQSRRDQKHRKDSPENCLGPTPKEVAIAGVSLVFMMTFEPLAKLIEVHNYIISIYPPSDIVVAQVALLLILLLVLLDAHHRHHQRLRFLALVEQLLHRRPIPFLVENQLESVVDGGILGDGVLVVVGNVVGWREDGIKADPQRVLQHVRDDPMEEGTAQL